jgi:DNA-binding response OmpR family regulator
MPFDDYLTKPVTRADLLQAVESMLDRAAYDDAIQEYFALCSKKATLEAEKTPTELAANDEYREMVARAREMRTEVDSAVTGFEDDVEKLFLELPGRQ